MTSSTTDKHGFTLIELLAVIAIIGIIMAVGIPTVTHLMKSGAVQSATRGVSSTMSLARQYAITQRAHTRVVFPYSATTGAAEMQYRTYSVVVSNREASTAEISAGRVWNYASKWEYLPVGAVFLNGAATTGALDNAACVLQAAIPFPATNSSPAQLAYIEFKPTGAASRVGTITVAEGILISGAPMTTSVNRAQIFVDNVVGRVRVTRP